MASLALSASPIQSLLQKSNIITKKRSECAQQKIFFLTGLNQSIIDEIIKKSLTSERIGKGGFSTVYKVNHDDRNFAVKYEKYDKDITKDVFELELSIALYLTANDRTRPYVPFTFGGRADEQGGFIVMELIDGINLQDVLYKRHISEEERIFIKKKLEDAISALHSVKVMHLDITNPLNILILFDYNNIIDIVLIDFNASNYTNYSRPYNILYNYNNSESPAANLQFKHINRNRFFETNGNNIKIIHTAPRVPRIYETLLSPTPEQLAQIDICERELGLLETEYYQLQRNSYLEREVEWLRKIDEHNNKIKNKNILRKWMISQLNPIISNDEQFLELFGEDLFNFLYSIFQKYRQHKIYFRTSYNKAMIPTKEIAQLLYNRYKEQALPLGKDDEEVFRRNAAELFESRRLEFEGNLIRNGNTGFKGGKSQKMKKTIRQRSQIKTQKRTNKKMYTDAHRYYN